jgi:signal transduction histidine kinase
VVLGDRATPYEVLGRFSERMAAIQSTEDVLPGMARLLFEGTGCARAEVWLGYGAHLRLVASWPSDEPGPERAHARDTDENDGRTVLVRHHGEVLGALSIRMRPGLQLSPPEEKLLADLAGQAGLVLRNARLVEDVRQSRERLITAQDGERRRLERHIRARVERPLAAVATALDCPQTLVRTDDERRIVTELRAETARALTELQDLARGVYPPLLADDGLAAALLAHVRAVPLSITIEADGVGRLPQDVEAAVYFCCLEALQNVAKHANAHRVRVSLSRRPSRLDFRVDDDGVGFEPGSTTRGSGLQNMVDRAESLGGSVRVSSALGRGTTVSGWLPALAVEPAL